MTHGCKDCKYCKCYTSNSYWDPDEYECVGFERDTDIDLTDDELEDIFTRVWENGEEWKYSEDQICPAWKEAPTEEDEYWARYAYEENRMEKCYE